MQSIQEYFPRHVWAVLFCLAAVPVLGLFVPPSATEPLGFSLVEHIITIGIVQFGSAVGIGALVVAYRDPPADEQGWRYDP